MTTTDFPYAAIWLPIVVDLILIISNSLIIIGCLWCRKKLDRKAAAKNPKPAQGNIVEEKNRRQQKARALKNGLAVNTKTGGGQDLESGWKGKIFSEGTESRKALDMSIISRETDESEDKQDDSKSASRSDKGILHSISATKSSERSNTTNSQSRSAKSGKKQRSMRHRNSKRTPRHYHSKNELSQNEHFIDLPSDFEMEGLVTEVGEDEEGDAEEEEENETPA